MDWYDILESARKVARKGQLTSETLGLETKLPIRVASAWLSKFRKWGYVLPTESRSADGIGKRWIRVYKLTRWGERMKPMHRQKKKQK